ncbi:lysosome membrane protein 2-like [Callorhinchus milii]|uniref:MLGP85/LIMP II n=1 Tax=Callorhinchus milii TaxID=7868 RepID=K4FTI4_CALMI|nr:lysosome membrane protein 2-like [Callorhinchus milii]AFK11473.1 mLGP85/LIMP II [Callorhinchus milii]
MMNLQCKVKLVGVLGLCCFIVFVVSIVKDLFKKLVDDQIKEQMVLKFSKPDEVYQNWKEPPIPVYIQFFFFHIENRLEVLQGERPYVRQIGPYTYKELRPRVNISLFENATISASTSRTYILDLTMSVGDPKKDRITTINIPFVTLLQMLKYTGPSEHVIASLISILKSEMLFQTRTVDELLWGYEDPLLKLGHKFFPSIIPHSRFGLFYGVNGTSDGEYLFNTGKNDYMKFTKIILWKGQKSMYAVFEKELEVQGIRAYRFIIPKEIFANATENPDNKGFCTPPGNCQPGGVQNVSICKQGAPIFISSPHFYNGDQKLVEDIDGLNPSKEAHQTFLDIEPKTGIPVRIAKRLQLNIHVETVPNIVQTGKIRTMFLPVLFLNESALIDDNSATRLKTKIHEMNILLSVPYIILSIGGLLCLICIILFFVAVRCNRSEESIPILSKLKETN